MLEPEGGCTVGDEDDESECESGDRGDKTCGTRLCFGR